MHLTYDIFLCLEICILYQILRLNSKIISVTSKSINQEKIAPVFQKRYIFIRGLSMNGLNQNRGKLGEDKVFIHVAESQS